MVKKVNSQEFAAEAMKAAGIIDDYMMAVGDEASKQIEGIDTILNWGPRKAGIRKKTPIPSTLPGMKSLRKMTMRKMTIYGQTSRLPVIPETGWLSGSCPIRSGAASFLSSALRRRAE